MTMINHEDRNLLYEYIKLDMAVKSLQQDYSSLESLKMGKVYINIVEGLLKNIKNDFYNKKRLLGQRGIRVVKWVKTSEHFSEVTIATKGEDMVLQYAKQALKTQVEELISGYLNK